MSLGRSWKGRRSIPSTGRSRCRARASRRPSRPTIPVITTAGSPAGNVAVLGGASRLVLLGLVVVVSMVFPGSSPLVSLAQKNRLFRSLMPLLTIDWMVAFTTHTFSSMTASSSSGSPWNRSGSPKYTR
jgi:hypothetical protein